MTLWISHRGYTKNAIENTIEAFRAARGLGFPAVETDLRVSSDGTLLLWHDCTLSSHLPLFHPDRDIPIYLKSYKELATIVLERGISRGHLLRFDSFAEEFSDLFWTLDIKPERASQSIDALYQWWNKRGCPEDFFERTRFLVWSHKDERLLHKVFAGQKLRLYARSWACYTVGFCALMHLPLFRPQVGRIYAVTEKLGPFELFRPEFIKFYHRHGAHVVAYLPSSMTASKAALDAGVDEILTNFEMVPNW